MFKIILSFLCFVSILSIIVIGIHVANGNQLKTIVKYIVYTAILSLVSILGLVSVVYFF